MTTSDPARSPDHQPTRNRPTRKQQRETRWRETKGVLLEGLRELRADVEYTLLSPSLERAGLYTYWRRDDPAYPTAPDARQEPEWEDEGEQARGWRERQRAHEQAREWARSIRLARRMRPHNTWRRLGSAGERGGPRAGMSAYPGAWNAYLTRVDPDGLQGDGWASMLGVAFRRIEREQGQVGTETRLYRALWLMSDPRRPDFTVSDLARALGVSQRQAYRWLDAALKRLYAEVEAQARGRERAWPERRAAEHAERDAWEHEN